MFMDDTNALQKNDDLENDFLIYTNDVLLWQFNKIKIPLNVVQHKIYVWLV